MLFDVELHALEMEAAWTYATISKKEGLVLNWFIRSWDGELIKTASTHLTSRSSTQMCRFKSTTTDSSSQRCRNIGRSAVGGFLDCLILRWNRWMHRNSFCFSVGFFSGFFSVRWTWRWRTCSISIMTGSYVHHFRITKKGHTNDTSDCQRREMKLAAEMIVLEISARNQNWPSLA